MLILHIWSHALGYQVWLWMALSHAQFDTSLSLDAIKTTAVMYMYYVV